MKINQITSILLIFGALSLVLIIFLIYPLFNEIIKNSQELISAKNDILTMETQVKEIGNFKKNYETYKADLDRVDSLFVDPNYPVDFIEFLENSASASGVSLKISLSPAYAGSSKSAQDFVTIQFSSTGEFPKMASFIKKIETGPYLIEIQNVTIGNTKEEEKLPAVAPAKGAKTVKIAPVDYANRKVDASFTLKVFTKL